MAPQQEGKRISLTKATTPLKSPFFVTVIIDEFMRKKAPTYRSAGKGVTNL